jgi:hypothetical protein
MLTTPRNGTVTAEEICAAIGAKEPSVKKALQALGYIGQRDLSDRRRVVYPAEAVEKVRQWLLDNAQYR